MNFRSDIIDIINAWRRCLDDNKYHDNENGISVKRIALNALLIAEQAIPHPMPGEDPFVFAGRMLRSLHRCKMEYIRTQKDYRGYGVSFFNIIAKNFISYFDKGDIRNGPELFEIKEAVDIRSIMSIYLLTLWMDIANGHTKSSSPNDEQNIIKVIRYAGRYLDSVVKNESAEDYVLRVIKSLENAKAVFKRFNSDTDNVGMNTFRNIEEFYQKCLNITLDQASMENKYDDPEFTNDEVYDIAI